MSSAAQFQLWSGQTTATGEQRRDRGTASVLSHFAVGEIITAITLVGCRLREFTSEEVVVQLPPSVVGQLQQHPNALGAAMRAAGMRGVIERTGAYATAKHAGAHGRKIAVWRLKPKP
jgi:hypothetical protein